MKTNVDSMLVDALGSSTVKPDDFIVWSQVETTKSTFPRPDNPSKRYMLKDLSKLAAHHDHVDLDITLLIDDSPEKNLLNGEFNAIHPPPWTGDMADQFLTTVLKPWLTDMFSSGAYVAEFVQKHPLPECQDGRIRATELSRNIVTGCSRSWDPSIGKFR